MTHRPGLLRTDLAATFLLLARRLGAAAAIVLAASPLAHGADPKVLNIYNWSDYIADDTIKNFEKETGIKVNYDNYDSNEVLLAKLVAGNSGYDIVVPGAHFAKTQIEGGLLQKLDRSKLSNWGNLDPTLLKQLAAVDPGNQYLVDWLWGYVTVGINVPKVKAALGDLPMPDNAWSLIFDPKYAGKLKGCGVNFLDSASEVLPVALLFVGKPPYSTNADDYEAAAKMLRSVRPYVTRFSSSGYINDLAGGSLCAVMGYSGDINIARARALEANPKQPAAIEALIPRVLRFNGDSQGRQERRQRAPLHQLHPASRCRGGADEQGLLRQPERGVAQVRQEGRRREQDDLPLGRRPGANDAARCRAAGDPARADAHLHQLQGGPIAEPS
jgi:putrescine transport system substrate-binding protein